MKTTKTTKTTKAPTTQNDLTELVFILDKSGSMGGLEADTIGGYNAMLAKQQALPGECRITTVLFDHRCELLHDRLDLPAVRPLTQREYTVGGSTALLDAVGRTIDKIANAQRHAAPGYRAQKVLFVIITDGEENSSTEYSAGQIKRKIQQQTHKYGWEFLFLGANLDAVETAGRFGIAPTRAQTYHADSVGVRLNYQAMSGAVTAYRQTAALPTDWNKEIQADYKRRK